MANTPRKPRAQKTLPDPYKPGGEAWQERTRETAYVAPDGFERVDIGEPVVRQEGEVQ